MKKSKFKIILSTPNNRGIHRYAQSINDLLKNIYDSKLVIFENYSNNSLKFIRFFKQIIWEFFFSTTNKENLLFAYPRLPFYEYFQSNEKRNYKVGIVVLDFIQCIEKINIYSLIKLSGEFGILEVIKRLIHTALFNFSIKNTDYFIVISKITKNNLIKWISQKNLTVKNNIFVIHPLPSFNEAKILNYISRQNKNNKIKKINYSSTIEFVAISGKSPSKGSNILLPIFKQLANLNASKTIKLKLFGVDILKDSNLEIPNNLKIKCYPSIVSDYDLIDAYVNSLIFISTSSEEGFGIPFLDALLFGCNCLCSGLDVYNEIKLKYLEFNQNIYLVDRNKKSVIDDFVFKSQEIISKNKFIHKTQKIEIFLRNYRKIYKYHLSGINKLPIYKQK